MAAKHVWRGLADYIGHDCKLGLKEEGSLALVHRTATGSCLLRYCEIVAYGCMQQTAIALLLYSLSVVQIVVIYFTVIEPW